MRVVCVCACVCVCARAYRGQAGHLQPMIAVSDTHSFAPYSVQDAGETPTFYHNLPVLGAPSLLPEAVLRTGGEGVGGGSAGKDSRNGVTAGERGGGTERAVSMNGGSSMQGRHSGRASSAAPELHVDQNRQCVVICVLKCRQCVVICVLKYLRRCLCGNSCGEPLALVTLIGVVCELLHAMYGLWGSVGQV